MSEWVNVSNNRMMNDPSNRMMKPTEKAFLDMDDFSKRNIFYCRRFYLFYAESSMQQLAALNPENSNQQVVRLPMALFSVPWGHHVVIMYYQ
jgi:hypothetical protein